MPGLMAENLDQHRAFHDGMLAFKAYCTTTTAETYDSKKLLDILDSFCLVLQEHLTEEIDTLLALEKFDAKQLEAEWAEMERGLIARADKVGLSL